MSDKFTLSERLRAVGSPLAAEASIALDAAQKALVHAKQDMWVGARNHWTMEDFNNWATVEEINHALALVRAFASAEEPIRLSMNAPQGQQNEGAES